METWPCHVLPVCYGKWGKVLNMLGATYSCSMDILRVKVEVSVNTLGGFVFLHKIGEGKQHPKPYSTSDLVFSCCQFMSYYSNIIEESPMFFSEILCVVITVNPYVVSSAPYTLALQGRSPKNIVTGG